MAKYNKNCGPDAVDKFDDYTRYGSGEYDRTHDVTGTGVMTSSNASGSSYYNDTYRIGEGITELANSCLSRTSIKNIYLPKQKI